MRTAILGEFGLSSAYQMRSLMRSLVSAGAVVLLHLGFLAMFFFANYADTVVNGRTQEIEVRFPPPPRQNRPISPLPPQLITPSTVRRPQVPDHLFIPETLTAPIPNPLSGAGRMLFDCDPEKRDLLSPQDRTACPHSIEPFPHSVRMPPPPDENSPFTHEIEERFREARPINRPCPSGSFNDTHGLPCFAFDDKSPLLPRP